MIVARGGLVLHDAKVRVSRKRIPHLVALLLRLLLQTAVETCELFVRRGVNVPHLIPSHASVLPSVSLCFFSISRVG